LSRFKRRKYRSQRIKSNTNFLIVTAVAVVIAVVVVAVLLTARDVNSGTSIAADSTTSTDSRVNYLSVTSSTPVLGSKSAPVTIFEFGDFQCTTCDYWFKTQEAQVIQNLINTSQAKLVWRDFDYYGPDSTYASEGAYAAGEQGKFWQFYDALYSHQQTPNSGWASKSNLINLAESLGLNMAQFNQSFSSGKYDSIINGNYNAGRQLGITGTPTFFLVGPKNQIVQIVGAQPASVFEQQVSSMISR